MSPVKAIRSSFLQKFIVEKAKSNNGVKCQNFGFRCQCFFLIIIELYNKKLRLPNITQGLGI